MKLHKKTLLTISVAIAGLVGVLYTASSTILLHSMRTAEEQETRQVMTGVLNVFSQTQDDFSSRFTDWSAWDDTYKFIEDSNKAYSQANTVPETLANLKVNLVLFINSSGRLVYGTGFDLKSKKKTPIPQMLEKHLAFQDILVGPAKFKSNVTGIVLLPEGPMLVTSQSIVTSKGEGPIRGTIIFGRYLEVNKIEQLIRVDRLSLTWHSFNSAKLPLDFEKKRFSLSKSESVTIERLNEQTIAGYTILPDIYGKPALLLQVNTPRKIYKQAQISLRYLIASLVLVGLVFIWAAVLLAEKLIVSQQESEELKKINQLKDDFLSTVSHELRTPLTNMKMAMQMLEISILKNSLLSKNEQIYTYLKILQYECNREISLINDLLDLQRLEAGSKASPLETIELESWINKLIEPFKERVINLQQTLRIDISPNIPPLVSNPLYLERILVELLNNACKYTPPGEYITVSAQVNLERLQLSVCNSGIEIPIDEQTQIFTKFYRIPGTDRWKQGGTGLGLALVKKITEHLGGCIKVESACSQTCFVVELPMKYVTKKFDSQDKSPSLTKF